jgi:hypothetical protein
MAKADLPTDKSVGVRRSGKKTWTAWACGYL